MKNKNKRILSNFYVAIAAKSVPKGFLSLKKLFVSSECKQNRSKEQGKNEIVRVYILFLIKAREKFKLDMTGFEVKGRY